MSEVKVAAMSEKEPLLGDAELEKLEGAIVGGAEQSYSSFPDPRVVPNPTQAGVIQSNQPKSKWEGLTFALILSVAAAVVGSSTQFGFNTGVINSPKKAIQSSFPSNGTVLGVASVPFSDDLMTVAVAIFAVGGMMGALPAGVIADYIGRKYTLLLNNILLVVAVLLQSFAIHPFMFIAGRIVVGINSGINSVVVPLYISEISPVSMRGSLGVCHQMAITTTILLSEILGLNIALGRPDSEFYGWRVLFAFPLLFSVFQLVTLPFCPESPKYLFLKKRKERGAIEALKRLRGSASIDDELQNMTEELEELQKPKERLKFSNFLFRPSLRLAVIVSIVLHLSQQLSGIVGIFYYSTDLFKAAGLSNGDIATVAVGVVLVIFTLITVFLIEVVGRRTLMLYGLGGMAICFAFLTSMFCFKDGFYSNAGDTDITAPGVLLIVASLGITALFALGPGAIPWLMVSEMFLQESRAVAVTIATIVNWLANFVVGLAFPYILKYLYPYGTGLFIVSCALIWLFLYFFLPETKGRYVEDITQEFKIKTGEVADSNRSRARSESGGLLVTDAQLVNSATPVHKT
ncbi:solute carrier family 2, facilitated glucose transporter member 3-like [Halichondria panicea]|uniref:solute carrier family 2, facilitated glucose transporter member 3-like n=1 Tax=Halichondria panicea TaxID=6063 RepID=UPI00312B5406